MKLNDVKNHRLDIKPIKAYRRGEILDPSIPTGRGGKVSLRGVLEAHRVRKGYSKAHMAKILNLEAPNYSKATSIGSTITARFINILNEYLELNEGEKDQVLLAFIQENEIDMGHIGSTDKEFLLPSTSMKGFLQIYRRRYKLSRNDVAEMLGVVGTTYYRSFEHGAHKPTVKSVKKLLDVLLLTSEERFHFIKLYIKESKKS
jgi:transcriptional regulator with XRE-family HTH domain